MTEPVSTESPQKDSQRALRRAPRWLLLSALLALWLMLSLTLFLFFRWQSARQHAADGVHVDGARTEALPILQPAPDFALVNRDGRTVRSADLLGRPFIVDFIFTRCPGVCPILSTKMQTLAEELPAERVRLVSITVDPEYDTPEVLESYAEKHRAGDNWLFLTGQPDSVYSLIREGFKLVLDPSPMAAGGDAIVHSNRFVLVDAEGQVRGFYDAFNPQALADLERDVLSLTAD